MNMQAMLKQAQKLQKDMLKTQEEIKKMNFTGNSSNVTIMIDGSGNIINVKIDFEAADKEEIEMIQDMIMIAFNDAKKQLDEYTESKMGSYTKGMPGLF